MSDTDHHMAVVKGLRTQASKAGDNFLLAGFLLFVICAALIGVYFWTSQLPAAATPKLVTAPASAVDRDILTTLTFLITRLGSIFLGLYMVQLTFNITRYQARLAHHLRAAADAIELANGQSADAVAFYQVLAAAEIDMVKVDSGHDKVADILKDLAARLPALSRAPER